MIHPLWADAPREVVIRMLDEDPPDSSSRVYVPLREAGCGIALRLFRDQGGERCAVGFTRLESLVELLGADQHYYRLTTRSVRDLAAQRGVEKLMLDPALVAAPVRDLEPLVLPPTAPATAAPFPATSAPALHLGRGHRPPGAVRTAFERSQAAGILVVSAGAGAAALVLEALR